MLKLAVKWPCVSSSCLLLVLEQRDVSCSVLWAVCSALCCGGAVPSQISAQSVQSSGGDERWGLGGNATTHWTGKSGSRSSCNPPVTQPSVGTCVFPYISRHMRSSGGGWEQLLWAAHRGGQSHLRCLQHFQPSLNLKPSQLPGRSAVRLPLPPAPGPERWRADRGAARTRHQKVKEWEDGGLYGFTWGECAVWLPLFCGRAPFSWRLKTADGASWASVSPVSAVEQRPNSVQKRSFNCPSSAAEVSVGRSADEGLKGNTLLRPRLVFGNILCHSKHLLLVYCYKLENCFPLSLLSSISSTVGCDGLYLQLEL